LVLTDTGPVLTSAGSFFSSSSANLVANDTNSQPDIFVAAPNGGISRINLPSQSEWTSGAQLAGATDSGRILAVLTSSAEVAGPERNQQLVLLDQATKKYVVASSGAAGVGNNMVVTALISPKGDAAAFVSLATNLTGQPPATFGGSLFLVTGLADIFGIARFVSGTSGNDALSGISGSMSEIRGGAGNDTLTGGSRADVAVFSGNRADYTITTVAGVTTVRDNRTGSPDGTDTLRGMNILRFADIQLFQSSAANRVILAGQAQTYFVSNSEVVQGTNAAEQFIVAPGTSALVFAGNNDVVDLSGSIGSYSFARAGTQLQISDGTHTTALGVGGSFTLRTASGSTSVAIDFTQGGTIKLGGTQIVGSTTFDPLLAINDRSNYSQNAIQKDVIATNGASYVARDNVADVFVIDASKSLVITISGFDEADRIIFTNRTSAEGASFDAGVIGDGISTITAGNASITLTNLANDNFSNETTFEAIYGANAIGYVI